MKRELILILLFIIFVNLSFTSAKVGYNNAQGVNIDTSTITNYFNGSNINASSITCSGTDKFSAYDNATGVFTCDTDQTGAGGGVTWIDVSNGTIALTSTIMNGSFFNPDLTNYIQQSQLNNGTYIIDSILNNGSYFNSGTGTTWAEIGNGTILFASQWNSTNTSYALASNLENGSYFNVPETDPKWTANQSLYTLLTTLNNGSYFNDASEPNWNANYSDFLTTQLLTTNGTFYLASNPSSFTTLPLVWNTLSNGTLALNNATFFNTDTFVANYSAFLNKVNWADVNNGTITGNPNSVLWGDVNNGTIFPTNKVSWADVFNGTLLTANSNIGNWTLDKPNWVAWSQTGNGTLATTNSIWTTLSNGTLVLYSTLNNGTYITNTILNNGTYGNVNLVNWADLSNGTLVLYTTLNNGTYITNTILNNGTYSAVDTDTFVANYSIFLTHVTYPQVMNGTLTNKIWTDLANSTMVAYSTLNNGSYFNVGGSDTFAGNYTNFSSMYTLITNGTFLRGAEWNSTNSTYNSFLTNNTFVQLTTLNNGTYFRTNQWNSTNTSYDLAYLLTTNGTFAKLTSNTFSATQLISTTGGNQLDLYDSDGLTNERRFAFDNEYNGIINVLNISLQQDSGSYIKTILGLSSNGEVNITSGNLTIAQRTKLMLDSNTCTNMQSGEICRNATGVFIKG